MKTDLRINPLRVLFLLFIGMMCNSNTAIASDTDECEVSEDLPFEMFCPPTRWLNCKDEIWDLSWLGNATYKDYTGTHDAGIPIVVRNLNDCNVGTITRTWKVLDYNSNWRNCTQTIYVQQGTQFNSSTIKWPGNVALTGCNPPTEPENMPSGKGIPTWSTSGATCSKIGYSHNDNVFVYGPGCYEIIRTWRVVDCCNFNPWTNTGIWTYNQRITVTTASNQPQVWVPYGVTAETSGCQKAWVDIPPLEVKDGCEDQYIITNNSPFAFKNGADASGKYPVGTTRVRFMVKYNCWETKFYYVDITVIDKSTPVPYCYLGLSVPLMGVDVDGDDTFDDGMREIWASEFDAGSHFPCNPNVPLQFSFSPDPKDNVRVFTCEDVGQLDINIYVTAATGQQDYCSTYVRVQNNAANIPNCEAIEEAMISGQISSVFSNTESLVLDVNSSWEGMEFDTTYSIETEVVVMDSTANEDGSMSYDYGIAEVEIPAVDTTHVDKDFQTEVTEGEYMLEDLELNEDYVLTLSNVNAGADFIDSMDVVMLSAFLEGKVQFSMYQKMAADLNRDLIVDFDDLALLNDYVNGSNTDLLMEWVTYDPEHEVPSGMETDVDAYPTSKMVTIRNRNAVGVNLMVFQMGDLTHEESLEDLIDNMTVTEREMSAFEFQGVSPNPFNMETTFTFTSDKSQDISLEIFTMDGKKVFASQQTYEMGAHTLSVKGSDLEDTGIYIFVLRSENATHQGKLIQIK